MRNRINLLVLALFLSISIYLPKVGAEQSATGYQNPARFYDQQVYIIAFNNSGASVTRDKVIVLDTAGTAGTTLGAYFNTTTTTDNVLTLGVTDETIADQALGRICVRGPHKVVLDQSSTNPGGAAPTRAQRPAAAPVLEATCGANNNILGGACAYSTGGGTTGGSVGVLLSNTPTTDTGDAVNTYWIWVRPNSER